VRILFYGYINDRRVYTSAVVGGTSKGSSYVTLSGSQANCKIKFVWDVSANNLKTYYDTGSGWTLLKEYTSLGTSGFSTPIYMPCLSYNNDLPDVNFKYSNFNFTGTFESGTVSGGDAIIYRTSGNWTSDTISITTGKKLKSMTIDVSGLGTYYNITKVEWLNSTGTVKAYNNTVITSGTSITYYSDALTSGSFDYLNDTENMKIKIYLQSNGTSTPTIEDIYGYYETTAGFFLNNLYELDSYNIDNTTNIEFAENQTVRIKANISGCFYKGIYYPKITIYYPNGTIAINQKNMTNESVLLNNTPIIYYYNYTINVSDVGFWDVKIEGVSGEATKEDVFYTGQIWNDSWHNRSGTTFPFRLKINISDPDIIDRRWEVIDQWINFSYKAHNNSIRVCYYNGTHMIEIPSQYYNSTINADGTFNSANIVFMTSLERNTNRTFYVYYSKYNLGPPNYVTDLYPQNQTNNYIFNNSKYNITNTKNHGGVITYAKCIEGTNTNIGGYESFELGAAIHWLTSSAAISSVSDPEYVTFTRGPLFSKLEVSSRYKSGGAAYYNLSYIYYAHNPYYIEEINTTTQLSDSWDHYNDFEFIPDDGIFTNVSWKNSTGTYTYPVTTGNGPDYTDLTGIEWIIFYNNNTGNTYGDIFLEREYADLTTPTFYFYDTADYELYRRTIAQSYSPDAGDYFYAKKAGIIWNGFTYIKEFNETYYRITNPVNVTTNQTSETYDTEHPLYSENTNYLNYTPQNPTDTQNITCFSFWTDNLGIDHVTLIENSTGTNITHTNVFDATKGNLSGWANYTMNANNIIPGNITCIFIAYDIASLTNITNFTFYVLDATKPIITNISYFPNTTADLDPNVDINITVNVTDTGIMDKVILQYRANNTGIWANKTMSLFSGTLYNATIKPNAEANWTIRIIANDTLGNINISASQNITVKYDKTWYLIPTTFSETSSQAGESANVTNITINNTGDYDLNFSVRTTSTTGFDPTKVTYYISNTKYNTNNKNITVNKGASQIITIELTALNNPRTDNIVINVTANETTENSTSQLCSGTFISSIVGPYLELTFYDYPSSIYQGNNSSIGLKVRNIGNEIANDVWVKYTLPSGWSIGDSDYLNKSLGDVFSYDVYWNNITELKISSSAQTGDQTLFVEANSSTGGYSNASIVITILQSGTTVTTTEEEQPTGGGGGGSSGGISGMQREKLFQTQEIYELVKGRDNKFIIKVENTFPNTTIENITLKATGLLSKYISIYPEFVSSLSENKSVNFTVVINAPKYFTKGDHKLEFIIKSKLKNLRTGNIQDMTEEREIILSIHDISRETAKEYIEKSKCILNEMMESDMIVTDIQSLFNSSITEFNKRNYETVQELYQKIEKIYQNAIEAKNIIKELEEKINVANYKLGLNTDKTKRILNLAKLAFTRGDYSKAIERLNEAKLTFALETKGEYNIPFLIITYWYYTLAIIVTIIITGFLLYKQMRLFYINHKLKTLNHEQNVLLGLMKVVQRDAFERKAMSMNEYIEAMFEYEKRLNKVVKDIIKYESEKAHLFKLSGKYRALQSERKRLLDLIKKTQKEFLTKGKYETRIYKNKMKSYSERFSEIEEQLASLEARRAIKKRKFKLLKWLKWKKGK